MSWFRKSPLISEDPQEHLVAYERVVPREYTPAPKPPDLVEAAERSVEWTRPQPTVLHVVPEPEPEPQQPQQDQEHPTVPFTRDLPTCPGVFWHVPSADPGVLHWLVVLRCGRSLCVMQRRNGSDSVAYVNVNRIGGWFAGPIPSPAGVDLSELRL
jgi:hypothetical protein